MSTRRSLPHQNLEQLLEATDPRKRRLCDEQTTEQIDALVARLCDLILTLKPGVRSAEAKKVAVQFVEFTGYEVARSQGPGLATSVFLLAQELERLGVVERPQSRIVN